MAQSLEHLVQESYIYINPLGGLKDIQRRLEKVVIENKSFDAIFV